MPIPVTRADFRKIVESDRQTDFSGLHLFPTQLADQTDGFAQREHQRGFVIVFVLRQRGAAGNCSSVFDFQNQRLIPLAVGKQPELLAPNAEFLPEQHGRQFGPECSWVTGNT